MLYSFAGAVFDSFNRIQKRVKRQKIYRSLPAYGKNVTIDSSSRGNWENVYIGNDVYIGSECLLMCKIAPVSFGNHVMLGPRVVVITGDHRVDLVGRPVTQVKNNEKLPENDQEVIFEGDNWVGANSVILKGVTVGFGSIIASGAVVTKNVPQNCIVGGACTNN